MSEMKIPSRVIKAAGGVQVEIDGALIRYPPTFPTEQAALHRLTDLARSYNQSMTNSMVFEVTTLDGQVLVVDGVQP